MGSDDEPLGRITDIYLDRDTGQPEWALVATPQRRRTFVPLVGAARKRDRVAVAVPKAAVSDAPAVRPGRELSDGAGPGGQGPGAGGRAGGLSHRWQRQAQTTTRAAARTRE
jgi:PRC-barrel domain